ICPLFLQSTMSEERESERDVIARLMRDEADEQRRARTEARHRADQRQRARARADRQLAARHARRESNSSLRRPEPIMEGREDRIENDAWERDVARMMREEDDRDRARADARRREEERNVIRGIVRAGLQLSPRSDQRDSNRVRQEPINDRREDRIEDDHAWERALAARIARDESDVQRARDIDDQRRRNRARFRAILQLPPEPDQRESNPPIWWREPIIDGREDRIADDHQRRNFLIEQDVLRSLQARNTPGSHLSLIAGAPGMDDVERQLMRGLEMEDAAIRDAIREGELNERNTISRMMREDEEERISRAATDAPHGNGEPQSAEEGDPDIIVDMEVRRIGELEMEAASERNRFRRQEQAAREDDRVYRNRARREEQAAQERDRISRDRVRQAELQERENDRLYRHIAEREEDVIRMLMQGNMDEEDLEIREPRIIPVDTISPGVDPRDERRKRAERREIDSQPDSLTRRYSRECGICFVANPRERAVYSNCGHTLCLPCAEDHTAQAARRACPFCREYGKFVKLFEHEESQEPLDSSNAPTES
ncbi:hypothetical protein PFISCL1PPCAC_11438, partial [Pristionchus fissidentatus]